VYDEKGKIPLARLILIIIGSGLGGSSVPQDLRSGQKEYPDRNILGLGRGLRNRRNDHR